MQAKITQQQTIKNKRIYSLFLKLLGTIPFLTALGNFLFVISFYLEYDVWIIRDIIGVSVLPMIFLYLALAVFQIPLYKRIFLDYVVIQSILIWLNYFGLPIEYEQTYIMALILAILCIITSIYLYTRYRRNKNKDVTHNRNTQKFLLISIKTIPILIVFVCWARTIISDFFDTEIELASFIAGTSLLPLLAMYLCAYIFRFCIYHRLFLHYISFNLITNTICDIKEWQLQDFVDTILSVLFIGGGIIIFILFFFHLLQLRKQRKHC